MGDFGQRDDEDAFEDATALGSAPLEWRVTSHSEPVYTELGVVHYGVPNMPGAVPWTATQVLNNSTLLYVMHLAAHGMAGL